MEIQWVTDKNGNDFYPVTHQKAVIVDGSKTLDKKLSEMESDISNKANPSSIPTNVSQLTNDSNYQTEAQVKSTVSNEVAKIVADAPENYDTLKEISDWISGHENDASAMNSAIKDNKSAITTLQTDKAEKTEIPTELPANGGNADTVGGHTVKSDVPENAVFTDTVYDDTEVKESISAQSTEITEIKMLGWSVPRECPVQNEVNGNQFVKKVGRVDLGSLGWRYDGANYGRFISDNLKGAKTPSSNDVIANIFLQGYQVVTTNNLLSVATNYLVAYSSGNVISIRNTSYTNPTEFKNAMQGKYLYYELVTPITTTIDGNEIGETVSDVRKETTVNLLNANQPSSVTSGVAKTNNGDGTYTIQGTATQIVYTNIGRVDNFETGVYKLIGTKVASGNVFLYVNGVKKDGSSDYSILTENTKPISLIDKSAYTYLIVGVAVANGVTLDETVKPMLTTNLSATYEDFVQYTGDSGSLNGDVADLRENVDNLVELGEDITD